jgi:predicted nucleotidyltransferase
MEDDAKCLSNAYPFIKSFLFEFVRDPRILYAIVRARENYSSPKDESLIESLSFSVFENVLADEPYEKKLLWVLAHLVKIEFEKPETYKQVFRRNSFAEKMLLSYLKRRACTKYTKFILKRPLLQILKDCDTIELDINK